VFEPFAWVFVVLLALNLALFAAVVIQREQWVVHQRVRERIRAQLAPVTARLLDSEDPRRDAEELRPVIAGLGRQSRAVAAWLVLDGLGEADQATRAAVCEVLRESGAVEVAERAARGRVPWRRALACEFLGTIGTERSVGVLVERLTDKRAEVRGAATRALGELGDPAAAGPLKAVFLGQDGIPIGVANDALSRLGPAGAEAFREGLRSPQATVRVTSCFGIAGEADPAARDEALALLEQRLRADEEPRVRSAAASAMRWLPGDVAPAALLDASSDQDPAVRRSAAKSLGAFDDPAAVAALTHTVSDPDRETALSSAESLLALSGAARAGGPSRRALAASRAWTLDSVRAIEDLSA
jgi:HEAT repeat protein